MSNFSLMEKYEEQGMTYQPVVEGFGLLDIESSTRPSVNAEQFTLVGWEYQQDDLDPFAITLDQFLSLPLEEAEKLQKKAYEICRSHLQDAWKKGVRQVVICDNKIIYGNTSSEDISTEIVEKLAREYNKACYVFSSPDMVEEYCVWTQIDDHDFYPTICMHLGAEDMEDSDLIKSTSAINVDFDTGNPNYRIFDANQFTETLTSFTALEMAFGKHLGVNYTYFQKKVKIGIKGDTGNTRSIVRKVRMVKDWQGSALLQTSPKRKGYVGRDIIRDLAIKLELDPSNRTTRILN